MNAVVTIVAKALSGGLLVVVFAALAETLEPKRFAGILSAAPTVALAGLIVGAIHKGPLQEAVSSRTMIAGAVGLTVFSAMAVPALARLGPARGAALASIGWLVAAGLVYWVIAP